MGQITIQLNNRRYALSCHDGDEARLEELAAHVSQRINTLREELGNVGDDRLMVMSLLVMADEMLDARERVRELEKLLPARKLSKLAVLAADQARTQAERAGQAQENATQGEQGRESDKTDLDPDALAGANGKDVADEPVAREQRDDRNDGPQEISAVRRKED